MAEAPRDLAQRPDDTIHSPEDFAAAYGARTWDWYEPVLRQCHRRGLAPPVLDLGAGLGLFMECCHRAHMPCIGLEGSRYAIEQARHRCPELDIRHHLLSQPLPFPDETFGTVMAHQLLEHLTPEVMRHVLCESRRVLKQGGWLFVFSPNVHDPAQRAERTHINLFTPRALLRAIRSAGFSSVRPLNFPRQFLGHSLPGRLMARVCFLLLPLDLLSASANCRAQT